MTELLLQKVLLKDGMVRFDLIGKGMPEDFLGLAADLNFKGKFAEKDYQGMALSAPLKALSEQNRLIGLAKADSQHGKVVVGLALKADQLGKLPDGILASFVFKDSKLEAEGFSNKVFSVFQGGRKDLSANWDVNNAVVNTEIVSPGPAISNIDSVASLEAIDDLEGLDVQSQEMAVAEPFAIESREVPSVTETEAPNWGLDWVFMGLGLGIVLVLGLIFLIYRKRLVNLVRNRDFGLVGEADFA